MLYCINRHILEVTLFFKFRNKAIIVPFPRLVIAFLFLREGEKEYEKNKSNRT